MIGKVQNTTWPIKIDLILELDVVAKACKIWFQR